MKNRIIKFLVELYKDEFGIAPALLAGLGVGAMGVGGLMSAFGGDDEEIYDPYATQRGQYVDYLTKKLGQRTPYQYNSAFTIPQPGIEKQTEDVVSKRLGSLPSANTYKEQVTAAKTQDIAREKLATEDQVTKERDMYNRLGLSSSTPWMSRAGEIGDESLMRQGDISSKYDMYGLDYNLKADQLANQIANNWTTQGQQLGSTQRLGSQFSTTASLQDLIRQIEEEQANNNAIGRFLGENPAERTLTPDILSQLGGTVSNIGSLGTMYGLNKLMK